MVKPIKTLLEAIGQLRTEHADLAGRLAAAKTERAAIAALPIAASDVIAAIKADLDARRPRVLERLNHRIEQLSVHDGDVQFMLAQSTELTGGHRLLQRDVDSRRVDDELLALLVDEALLKIVAEAFADEGRGKTITLAKRAAETARLDKLIADLEAQLQEAKAAADSAGVVLQ